jgi:hypothetical protein
MALASKHLAVLQPDHAHATPRGTCTAAEGLDAETFRGFQLAGELFLLTSFFIEPNVRRAAERLRNLGSKGLGRAAAAKGPACQVALSVRDCRQHAPVSPSKCHFSVNQKSGENFEVAVIWLGKQDSRLSGQTVLGGVLKRRRIRYPLPMALRADRSPRRRGGRSGNATTPGRCARREPAASWQRRAFNKGYSIW